MGEVIESLAGPDKALLVGSQPVAANEHHAILALNLISMQGQTMKRITSIPCLAIFWSSGWIFT